MSVRARHMSQRLAVSLRVAFSILCAGFLACGGGSSSSDGGATDLGADSAQMLLNCTQLNECTSQCSTAMCVEDCRVLGSASAVDKEAALQTCFEKACPQLNGICTPDTTGAFTAECLACISN